MLDKRLLALDIGEVRIGVALSDPSGVLASPYEVLQRKPGQKGTQAALREIAALVRDLGVGEVVVGQPRRTDGKPSAQEARVREFADLLQKEISATIVFVDERFTTRQATNVLLDADVSRAGRKSVVDKVAAAILLQQYLDMKQLRDASENE